MCSNFYYCYYYSNNNNDLDGFKNALEFSLENRCVSYIPAWAVVRLLVLYCWTLTLKYESWDVPVERRCTELQDQLTSNVILFAAVQ